jgi:hypothetical protein
LEPQPPNKTRNRIITGQPKEMILWYIFRFGRQFPVHLSFSIMYLVYTRKMMRPVGDWSVRAMTNAFRVCGHIFENCPLKMDLRKMSDAPYFCQKLRVVLNSVRIHYLKQIFQTIYVLFVVASRVLGGGLAASTSVKMGDVVAPISQCWYQVNGEIRLLMRIVRSIPSPYPLVFILAHLHSWSPFSWGCSPEMFPEMD